MAANSAEQLAQVKTGMTSSRELSELDIWIVVGIVVLVFFLILLTVLLNYRKKRKRQQGWSSISNPQTIWEVLSKAVSRQANFNIELYKTDHVLTYKGTVDSIDKDTFLVLTMADQPVAIEDFKDLPGVLHLNFRPAPKEPLEHYQFSTKVVDCRYIKTPLGWREAQLLLNVPKVLTSAQRRNFLRLEPREAYAFDCVLSNVPDGPIPNLATLENVCVGQILDISIGGAQLTIRSSVSLKETQRFVGVMELPCEELNITLTDSTLVLLIQLMSQDFIEKIDTQDEKSHSVLRLRFLGRYVKDPLKEGFFVYRGLTQNSMEDLAYWMQAYQRFIIKKKRHLLSSNQDSIRPPNMFPAQPPKRPPVKDS
jgi:hypothetical protein